MNFQLSTLSSIVNEDPLTADKRRLHDVLISRYHKKDIYPDLLTPDLSTGMAPFFTMQAFCLKGHKNTNHCIEKGGFIKAVYSILFISMMIVGRNKFFKRIYAFCYIDSKARY